MNSFTIKYNDKRPEQISVDIEGYGLATSSMDSYNKWIVRPIHEMDDRIVDVSEDGHEEGNRMRDILIQLPRMVRAIVCGDWEGDL